jgi:hypothetical protein
MNSLPSCARLSALSGHCVKHCSRWKRAFAPRSCTARLPRQDTASSDIDVLIVADDLSYAEAMTVLHPLDESLGRTVNPTIYTPSELRKRIDSGSSFVTRVWQQPRLWLIGSDDDLAA